MTLLGHLTKQKTSKWAKNRSLNPPPKGRARGRRPPPLAFATLTSSPLWSQSYEVRVKSRLGPRERPWAETQARHPCTAHTHANKLCVIYCPDSRIKHFQYLLAV